MIQKFYKWVLYGIFKDLLKHVILISNLCGSFNMTAVTRRLEMKI